MGTDSSSTDRPLGRDQLELLIQNRLILAASSKEVREEFRESIDWGRWLGRWALGLGAVLFACGVVFFFAYNWKNISPLVRFSSLEISVAVAALLALFFGADSPLGKWLLFGASVIAGVLVAVYGQVYQTGADAFEVFAMWALLIFAWVLVSRFAPLWVLWLAVAETALMMFWQQVVVPDGMAETETGFLVLGAFTIVIAALRSLAAADERFAWLRGAWLRLLLLGVTLFWFSLIPLNMIFDWGRPDFSVSNVIGSLMWLVVIGLGSWFYFSVRPSVAALGMCSLSLAAVITLAVGRAILEESDGEAIAWLIVGVVVVAVFGGLGLLISSAGKQIRERETQKPELS